MNYVDPLDFGTGKCLKHLFLLEHQFWSIAVFS